MQNKNIYTRRMAVREEVHMEPAKNITLQVGNRKAVQAPTLRQN